MKIEIDFDDKKYYPVFCTCCGWIGMSNQSEGGKQIADTGDYDDIYCPICYCVNGDYSKGNQITLEGFEQNTLIKLLREVKHWKSNHDNQVKMKKLLLDRPDIKERATLLTKLLEENERLKLELLKLEVGF